MKTAIKPVIMAAFTLLSSVSNAETTRQLDAHSHGEAALSIVMEGTRMGVFLVSPAANLVGFEHAPKNEEQKEQIDKAKEQLSEWNNIVHMTGGTTCESVETDVHWTLDQHEEHDEHKAHDEHAEHDEHEKHADHDKSGEDSTHSEFEAEYLLKCEGMDKLESLEVKLFQLFPKIEKLSLEAVLPDRQLVQVLTAADNQIQLSP